MAKGLPAVTVGGELGWPLAGVRPVSGGEL